MPDEIQKDPRFYLAAERTLLAWIRTGLALMGFGFVVARFGLFLREMAAEHGHTWQHSYGFSLWFGTALVLVGVVSNVTAVFQHVIVVRKIRLGAPLDHANVLGIALSLALALVGLAMAAYLILVE